ncbi:MAG: protein-glutamate O-methyltransferase CheR [Actinomycetales bacterium]|nr:protein-glutamate O-methyltransferase CheR [Actinomycetales bacterium]
MTITAESFGFVADLVRRRSGIVLEPGKEYLVEGRLRPLARAAELADVDTYVRALRADPRPSRLESVVAALTTNETSWFRDLEPFRALVDHVLPELLAHRPMDTIRVWSAACSTGQEPYSIAMVAADVVPAGRLRILATDLAEDVLERARRGRYTQLEINRGLPAAHLVRFFRRAGADWEVVPEVRAQVAFQRHNLLDAAPAGGPFDVVFLRNVLIYFDLATKQAVLDRVRRTMRPGGYLVLGAAETTIGVDDSWERVPVGRGALYRTPARRAA